MVVKEYYSTSTSLTDPITFPGTRRVMSYQGDARVLAKQAADVSRISYGFPLERAGRIEPPILLHHVVCNESSV